MGIMSAALLWERGRIFLTEVQKQCAVATLRRTVNETSINDTSDDTDSAIDIEPVHKKMKTDDAGNGAADFVADLFDRSTLMMVDEVDNYTSGTEVSDDLLHFWQGKSNRWP